MKQPVAFFDVDGTVFRSSLLIELTEALIDGEVFREDARAEYRPAFESWLNREGSYEVYIDALVQTYMQHVKGVHYGEVADIGRAVVEAHSKRVYRYTRDLIQELRAKEYFVVAISQSPKMILDAFCAGYGFDKVYGRIYEIGPTDRFTGEVMHEHLIANKANIVKRVMEDDSFTYEGSVAVGDTEGDISMLEMVERPICFNPNQPLFDHAQRVEWQVVVERKDVIYTL